MKSRNPSGKASNRIPGIPNRKATKPAIAPTAPSPSTVAFPANNPTL